MRKNKAVGFAIALLLLVCCTTAYAGIAVTPERHVLELSPGETGYAEYQVYNSGNEPLEITIAPEDLGKISENKDIDINSWTKIKEAKITVEPGGTKPFKVNVTVPKNAVGELNSMLYLTYKEQKASILIIRYGVPLYVLIKGTENISAQIKSVAMLTQVNPVFPLQKDMIIAIDVENTGNRHIWPKVWAEISDKNAKTIKRIDLAKPWPVFGEQFYTYAIRWDNYELVPGEYECAVFFGYDKDKTAEIKKQFVINMEGMAQ